MELLLIIFLVLLNGVFSMSEIALVSARKSRLQAEAAAGNAKAAAALALAQSPNRFLSTVQIGITLIGILTGVFSGASLSRDVQALVARVPVLVPYSETIAVTLMVVFITYLSVVVGELLPKRIGLTNPEGIAKLVAAPMSWLSRLATPFIWVLTVSSDFLIRLMGIKAKDNQVTEEEIKALVKEGASGGAVQEVEHDLVNNVFRLGDRRVGSLMTSRADVVWLDARADVPTLRAQVLAHKASVYPLGDGSLDEVLGMVHLKDLLGEDLDRQLGRVRALSQEAVYLPATSKAYHALELFRRTRRHHALVVDEFGGVMGLLTINDIFDALVGDIAQVAESQGVVKRADGSFLIDAQLPFAEFAEQFHLTAADRQGLSGFHTLGGFILHQLNALPRAGEGFTWRGHRFEIVDVDRSRLDKVLYWPKLGE